MWQGARSHDPRTCTLLAREPAEITDLLFRVVAEYDFLPEQEKRRRNLYIEELSSEEQLLEEEEEGQPSKRPRTHD